MRTPLANGTFNSEHIKCMWDKSKLILWPLLQKIARMALSHAGTVVCTWLVCKGMITEGDKATVVGLCGDAAPGLLLTIPGVAFELWKWFNKFDCFVRLQTTLHLTPTGRPSEGLVDKVQELKALASQSESGEGASAASP